MSPVTRRRRRRWWRRYGRWIGWRRRVARTPATAGDSNNQGRDGERTKHRHDSSTRGKSQPSSTRTKDKRLVLALQRVRRESGRDDRIAAGEPAPRQQEQAAEKERHADFRNSDRGTGTAIHGR